MKKLLLFVSLFVSCFKILAQDAQFSQYYSSFTYLNPALSGTIDNTRLGLQYRSQWKNIQSPFVSTLAYGAHYFSDIKTSVNFTYHGNQEGQGAYNQTFFMLGGSYTIDLGENMKLIPALQVGYNLEKLDPSNFVYSDQLTQSGATGSTAENLSGIQNINYADFNSGILLTGKRAFIGFSASHLSEPNNSFTGGDQKLHRKYNIHSGLKLTLNEEKERSWLITGLYKAQGKFDQVDLGTYIDAKNMAIGVWYRGLPLVKDFNGITNNESIVGMAGIKVKGINVSYSYDFVISDLSSNAHEISLYYEFRINKKEIAPKIGSPIPMF